ncbi:alpha-galactosidase [Pseudotabrizicola algicola]|uniref:alpha-galactosidase n=1 Tax=Pseudotabrizicola algicola TaxID=2709381 RepID=A0A6B3RMU0_9RHOB|nr:alpha-galactosidase [Pseudotabrizicola algicola]NEX46168.1 alpha-galactosidase [Pseudotabrizicola algicola]
MQWRLDAGGQTLALTSDGGLPAVIYWGARLTDGEDLAELAASTRQDLTGGMIDALPALTLTPESGRAFPGQPGLICAEADGTPLHPVFRFARADLAAERLTLVSEAAGMVLTHHITAQPTGVFTLQTVLEAERDIRVTWLAAPVLPAPQAADYMIDLHGRWVREFHLNHVAWTPGIRMREARTGRSGHEHPPYVILPEYGCTNTQGTAYALHYAWSGGHRMLAEELPDGRRQVQFGAAQGAETQAGRRFQSAELVAVHSASGLNGIGAAFQRDTRDRVVQWPNPARPRPVHYNCWEAIYFKHTLADLSEIADRAAALGAERFVLDDGWFGRRDDDTTSLGDWTIDRNKWPDGLHPLIAHVHSLGMTFGLWFEPEMVNPDSDLHRAHPDWMLGPVDQVTGRNQLVLDLARAEVRDYLFDAVSAILSEYDIDYIKWDHNRLLPVVDVAQTHGAYALFDRLRAAHPGVEIESCASGGGRIDAGILARTHRVWLSDCIDAEERLRMQHDAALFLPSCVTGSHVGALHSHTTGRALPISFRAWVAAQRHFGFEMDPRKISDADAGVLRDVTAWYKANRDWMMAGTILRLDSSDPTVTAEMQLAADGGRFVLFAGQNAQTVQILPRPLRLTGLDPAARYRITLRNGGDKPPQSRGPNALKDGPLVLSGLALMGQGLLLPVAWPATMWVVEGERL